MEMGKEMVKPNENAKVGCASTSSMCYPVPAFGGS